MGGQRASERVANGQADGRLVGYNDMRPDGRIMAMAMTMAVCWMMLGVWGEENA